MAFTYTTECPEKFGIGGKNQQVVSPIVLDSAVATIIPTHKISQLTGTGAVTTIQVPYDGFAGTIILIPDGASTFTNAVNIAVAVTNVANKAQALTYNPITGKWYPSYVA
jgi:hypothetical protein